MRKKPAGRASEMRLYDQLVRQCRAKHFIFTFAAIIHVAPNGPALARWWEATHGPTEDLQLNRKWDAYFRGALPQGKLLEQLIGDVPELATCLTNPIWYALSDFQLGNSKAFWNSCANAVRINDAPFSDQSRQRLDDLYAQPNLASLGLLIIMLRSDDLQHSYSRQHITRCFTCYVCIALLSDRLRDVADDIYLLIDSLIEHGGFTEGTPLGWPQSLNHFCRQYDAFHLIARWLYPTVQSERREADVLLLLWMVAEDHKLFCQFFNQDEVVIPPSILQRWRRWCKRFANHSTQLCCSECDTRLLSCEDKRAWCRLLL